MHKRPLSVTIAGSLFLVAVAMGLASHLTGLRLQGPFPSDLAWPLGVGLVGIVAGVGMLRGYNWARWLTLAWLASHVYLSALESRQKLAIHVLIFGACAALVFNAKANAYFRAPGSSRLT
ncbi:MAG TPA: hypothetical protein VNW46_05455 [Gemmatimonadaceae bacterium]|jgi:hypothetical protein|nr:hypothetical protein [Gemmatimonadaceae bacterium]